MIVCADSKNREAEETGSVVRAKVSSLRVTLVYVATTARRYSARQVFLNLNGL
jgi:hypothetical protein